ncbi:MAG: glutaminyl-peptide cyclotransferase [Flavobacteriaceae bacterium]|nr:glutaminyl-peptide cyclotransferase [Flavobacteriaceae bacterium]
MKWITMLLTIIALKSCGNENKDPKITLKVNQKTFVTGDTLQLSLKNKKNIVLDSIHYTARGTRIESTHRFEVNAVLGDVPLQANLFIEGNKYTLNSNVRLLNKTAPSLYTYTLLNEFPHDRAAYTQGLEFDGETLYESTGLRTKSSLRKVNYKTGEVENKIDLDASYFGEGLTLINDKIIQLTWQSNTGFVYNKENMEMERSFVYSQSKEGWGLCNDGTQLYKSDGSAKIWTLDAQTQKEISYVEATTNKTIVTKINELEWVNGFIYANTYQAQKDVVVIINPENGAVEGIVNFAGLRKKVEQIPNLDVLNGIAYHTERKTFFVTGKNWSKLFEVTLQKK